VCATARERERGELKKYALVHANWNWFWSSVQIGLLRQLRSPAAQLHSTAEQLKEQIEKNVLVPSRILPPQTPCSRDLFLVPSRTKTPPFPCMSAQSARAAAHFFTSGSQRNVR
jgi:hypothetical protein